MLERLSSRGVGFIIFTLVLLSLTVALPVEAALININTAGTEELDTLEGIGPAYAQRIIDYRSQNGPFQHIEDIKNVSGIGEVTFNNFKDAITVGTEDSISEETEDSDSSTQASSTSGSGGSTHYSAVPLSSVSTGSTASIGAGRDRVGVVGSPLEFRVVGGISQSRQSAYRWNFGDGTQSQGYLLNHTYEYPGEYVVVLHADVSGGEAVSRIKVKVVEAGLDISYASPERIELSNNSAYEINLFGRALAYQGQVFVFLKDTIIGARQKISFSSKVTGLRPAGVYEVDLIVLGEESNRQRIEAKLEELKLSKIAEIESRIAVLGHQVAQRQTAYVSASEEDVPEAESWVVEEQVQGESDEVLTASAVESSKMSGWLGVLKKFFLGDK